MTILITGATGAVGRLLIQNLLAEGQSVRAMTRRPDQADLPQAVEVVPGDLDERRFNGVEGGRSRRAPA